MQAVGASSIYFHLYLGVGDEKTIADSLFMFVVLDSTEVFFILFGTLLLIAPFGRLCTPLSVLLMIK